MSNRGHVVWAGTKYSVVDVRLQKGEVRISFYLRGPMDPFEGLITVFDEQGNACWQGSTLTLTERIPEGQTWTFLYGLRIAQIFDTGPKAGP